QPARPSKCESAHRAPLSSGGGRTPRYWTCPTISPVVKTVKRQGGRHRSATPRVERQCRCCLDAGHGDAAEREVDLLDRVLVELDSGSGGVVAHLLGASGADDR